MADGGHVRPMRAVMVLSENWTLTPPSDLDALVELACTAEACGVDTVMLSEHVVLGTDSASDGVMTNPRDYAAPGNQDPATPWPDSVVLAAAIAARTTAVRIALAALITPLRHPLALAKQLATLDQLAAGRLVVQPTVSWSAREYEALGVDFAHRGAILDEQLAVMWSAWTAPAGSPSRWPLDDATPGDGGADPATLRFAHGDVWVEPRRLAGGVGCAPAMWFGGQHLHGAILDRLVRYGSGFHPFGTPTADELHTLRAGLADAGRSFDDFELVGGIRGTFTSADDVADLDVALDTVDALRVGGYTAVCFKPSMFTDDIAAVGDVCRRVVTALDGGARA
jgi:alkanesulfonate monooxygenase SsuD/methylene tetrahydromethanopterin reductase-like flavin-dependent oxidoreductase (luciferase family)